MLKSFVVRVYRADKEGMSGEVESVFTKARTPFQDKEELWRILWAGTGFKRREDKRVSTHVNQDAR